MGWIRFYFAQFLGVLALGILLFSFQNNDKKTLLRYQIISSFLYGLEYLLLNAYSGSLISFSCMFRNKLFSNYDDKIPTYLFVLIVGLYLILLRFSYTGWISILPFLSVLVYTYVLWNGSNKAIRIGEVIAGSIGIIYNIKVRAIASFVAAIVEVSVTILTIFRIDFLKK